MFRKLKHRLGQKFIENTVAVFNDQIVPYRLKIRELSQRIADPREDLEKAQKEISTLRMQVDFLLDEVSDMRSLVRYLRADRLDCLPHLERTRNSFDFQWDQLPEGSAMLSNEQWKQEASENIARLCHLPPEWFVGKKVLDAGCGQGRWTYGFGKLQVGSCVSFDISEAGLAATKAIAAEFGESIQVLRRNVLEDLGLPGDFDLVWCFGLLHHTGDTFSGFRNLVRCVKPGGYLFLMLYGEPARDDPGSYLYYHNIFQTRWKTRNLPFSEKVEKIREEYGEADLHGYFDAISPEINDLYRWDEVEQWLIEAGFHDIKRMRPDHPSHHVIARKKG